MLVAGLWALLAIGPVPSPGAEPPRASEVQIRFAGTSAQVTAVERALNELLDRDGLHASVTLETALDPVEVMARHADDERLLARVAVDMSDRGVSSIVLVDTRLQRVLVRRVPTNPGVDQVAAEEVAHIVASSLRALSEGASIGVERAEAMAVLAIARPVAEPRLPFSPPPSAQRWELALGAAGGAATWSENEVTVPAIAASLIAHRTEARWGGELSLDFSTFVVRADPVSLRLTGGDAALQATFFWGTHVTVAAGPGVELIQVAPGWSSGAAGGAALAAAHWRMVPLFRLSLRIQQRIRGPWTFFGTLMADALLNDVRYTADRQGETQSLLDPWRVRPAALLGALMTFAR
jgi:hypothetical protein